MMFDPFKDFEKRGYLRNNLGYKDMELIKEVERGCFNANLPSAMAELSAIESLSIDAFNKAHKLLFANFYPWAGVFRNQFMPSTTVKKDNLVFANPHEIEAALMAGLNEKTPGKSLGYYAFAHPFLECNGRVMLTIVSEQMRRKNKMIQWSKMNRLDFLTALEKQINVCFSNDLDDFLGDFIVDIDVNNSVDFCVQELYRVQWNKKI